MTRTPLSGLALASLCLAASACAWNANAAPRSTAIASDPLVVDVDWSEDVPIVTVRLDAHGPYRFLLDTGAESTFVSPGCARDAGLELADGALRINAAGAGVPREVQTTTIDALGLGDARFSGVPAVVAETGPGLDGVLGFPLFADLLLTLDGPAARLVLERGRLPSPDTDPACVALVPGDVEHGSPRIHGRVGGHRALILIDSGFAGSLYLARSLPAQTGLAFRPDEHPDATVQTEAGRRDVVIGRLHERVEVGPLVFEDLPTLLGMGPPVILGGALLRETVTTFDQRGRCVRLAPAPR